MNNKREQETSYELIARLAAIESEITNIKKWNDHQNERMNKIEEQLDTKAQRLNEKIDKILDNEKKLLETINNADSSLDDKIDARFNQLQMWLLATAATTAIGLLMYILESIVNK